MSENRRCGSYFETDCGFLPKLGVKSRVDGVLNGDDGAKSGEVAVLDSKTVF